MNCTGNTSGIVVKRRATALNVELVGIGPMCEGRRGFNEQIFGADEQVPKGGCGPCPKNTLWTRELRKSFKRSVRPDP